MLRFYDYIHQRSVEPGRTKSQVVREIIEDILRDKDMEERTGQQIVNSVRQHHCHSLEEAKRRIVLEYRKYCQRNGLEAETIKFR